MREGPDTLMYHQDSRSADPGGAVTTSLRKAYPAVALDRIAGPPDFWLSYERFAYHESGHTVAGLALGLKLKDVSIRDHGMYGAYSSIGGHTDFGPLVDYTRPRLAAALRNALLVDVAGCVAEGLYLEWWGLGRWLTPREKRDLAGCSGYLPHRLSGYIVPLLRLNDRGEASLPAAVAPRLAFGLQFDIASTLTRSIHLRRCRRGLPPLGSSRAKPLTARAAAGLLPEIVKAERRAEATLRSQWDLVAKLARSLLARKSGRMTGRQVERLFGATE